MAARLPERAASRAVLIGTSEYDSEKLVSLPAVRNNLADLRAVLDSAAGCTVLENEPDAGEVGEQLVRLAGEATDLLLVYYAGHGLIWTDRHELYLALRTTKPSSVGTSALRCADVRQVFLDSPARTRVLILDCCFSGRAFERTMADPARAALEQVDVNGAYILTATQPNQLAKAPDGQRHTLFTGELLRLLHTGVPEGPELLTLDVLYRELKASMRRRNLPEPSCNNSGAAAQLALARNPAHHSAASGGEISDLRRRIRELERYKEAYPTQRAKLRAAITELTDAETETGRVYELVREKILRPGLAPLAPHSPALSTALAGLDRLAGQWTELAARMSRLEREAAEALEGTRSRRAVAQGVLDRREELRGRLEIRRAKAVRLNVAEKDQVLARYQEAEEHLWTKPCDLAAAFRAVQAYERAINDELEGQADG